MRRSAELLAIIMSFVIYKLTMKEEKYDEGKKKKMECGSNIFVVVRHIFYLIGNIFSE